MEDYVPEIVRLVKESAEIEFRESGFSYERFVQHMRCLIARAEKKEAYQGAASAGQRRSKRTIRKHLRSRRRCGAILERKRTIGSPMRRRHTLRSISSG